MTSALLVPRLAGLAAAGVTLLGAVTLAGSAATINPWFDLATHFRPHYVACGLLAFIVLGVAGWSRWASITAVLITWHAFAIWPYLWPTQRPDPPPANTAANLRVLNANVLTANRQTTALLDLVRDSDPDIVVLQEVDSYWLDATAELNSRFPFRLAITRDDNFGIAAFSRWPGSRLERIDLTSDSTPSISVELPIGNSAIYVLATHPVPPIGVALSDRRNRQLAAAAAWVGRWPASKLLVGDLNITPWSPAFAELLAVGKLRDSRREHGLAPTWPAALGWVGIPIDHALPGAGLRLQTFETRLVAGSDHRAILSHWRVTP
ncbi:MAG: endonuclease/exonuclease/phosphatase family protein [Pseudomonadota bacterium]